MRVTKVDPADYVGVVGASFAKQEHAPVLVIGSQSWTRWTLGRLGVPHMVAASALNRVVKELGITTIAGLARQAQQVGNYKGCGVTTYWLVLAILRANGYDVKAIHGEDVTYATVKQRARKAQKDSKKRRPRRAGPPSESMPASA